MPTIVILAPPPRIFKPSAIPVFKARFQHRASTVELMNFHFWSQSKTLSQVEYIFCPPVQLYGFVVIFELKSNILFCKFEILFAAKCRNWISLEFIKECVTKSENDSIRTKIVWPHDSTVSTQSTSAFATCLISTGWKSSVDRLELSKVHKYLISLCLWF